MPRRGPYLDELSLCRRLKSSLLGEFNLIDSPAIFTERHAGRQHIRYTETHELSHKDLIRLTCFGNVQQALAKLLDDADHGSNASALSRDEIRDALVFSLGSSRLVHEGWATFRERFLGWLFPDWPSPPEIGEPYISALRYFEAATAAVPSQYAGMRFSMAGVLARASMNTRILMRFPEISLISCADIQEHLSDQVNSPDGRLETLSRTMAHIEWTPTLLGKLRRVWAAKAPNSLRDHFDGNLRGALQTFFSTSSEYEWSAWSAIERSSAAVLHSELAAAREHIPLMTPEVGLRTARQWTKRQRQQLSTRIAPRIGAKSAALTRILQESVNYPASADYMDLGVDLEEAREAKVVERLGSGPFGFWAMSTQGSFVLSPLLAAPIPTGSEPVRGRVLSSYNEYIETLQVYGVSHVPTTLPSLADALGRPRLFQERMAELNDVVRGDISEGGHHAWIETKERLHITSLDGAERRDAFRQLRGRLLCLAFAPPEPPNEPQPEHVEWSHAAGYGAEITYVLGTYRSDFALKILLDHIDRDTPWARRVHESENHEWLALPHGLSCTLVLGIPRVGGIDRIMAASKTAEKWFARVVRHEQEEGLDGDKDLQNVAIALASGAFDLYFNPVLDRKMRLSESE